MFKKALSLVCMSFLVASCEPAEKPAADGYTFGTPQFELNQTLVSVVTYDNRNDLLKAGKERGITDPNLVAFSIVALPPVNKCTIHVMNPAVAYEPEFVGHELTHCLYGQWHTDNNSRS